MLANSLTAALRAIDSTFSVRLLYLGAPENSPCLPLGLPSANHALFVRDVALCLHGEPVVLARSQCSADSANWRSILDCGNRPLGEKLFDGSLPLTRSPFEFARLPVENQTEALVRRSRFLWNQETLWLAECFLPALNPYLTDNPSPYSQTA